MSKENKNALSRSKAEDEGGKNSRYAVSKEVLLSGYFASINGKPFGVSAGKIEVKSFQGQRMRMPVYGSVLEYDFEFIEGEKIPVERETGKTYFENLTPFEVHILTQAKVIVLNKQQEAEYNEWLKNVFYKKGENVPNDN